MEEGFAPVIKAIKKWEPEVRKQLRKELQASGNMIAAGSRLLAGAHSTTIPATIKVRTRIQSRKVEVEIRAGSAEVPIAGLYELGNKGSGKSETFRHPVFAREGSRAGKHKGPFGITRSDKAPWVNQKRHPFLSPIIKLRTAAVTKRVGAAVEAANEAVDL